MIDSLLHNTTFWVTVSFLLFAVFSWKHAKKAILAMLDKHIADIKADLDSAENLHTEAQELLAQYQRKQKDAQKDAEHIIETATKQAADMRANIEAETADTLALREVQLKERIRRIEEKAVSDIKFQITEISTQATLDIITKRLGKKENDNLIAQTIKEIPANIKKAS